MTGFVMSCRISHPFLQSVSSEHTDYLIQADRKVKTTVKRNFAGNDDSAPDAEQEAPVDDNDQSEERAQNAADQAAEAIRSALSETAYAMLSEFLTKTRQSRRKGGGSRGVDSRKIETVSFAPPYAMPLLV